VSPGAPLDRGGAKWDRAARYLRIARVLHGHPDGIGVQQIADQVGVSRRTIYRDLWAMEQDAGLPLWQDKGRWGLEQGAFLPPLALTLDEATTFVLAARVLAKASDERDTELISAYVKLAEILPPVLAEHLRATADAYAGTPRNERFTRVFRVLTQGWAERRVVEIEYGPGVYDPGKGPRRRRVRPYAIEPSALTRALYLIGFDETVGGRRTFKVERILEAALTPETFEGRPDTIAQELLLAWDVISDEPQVRVVVRFSAEVAARVAETRWHPTQESEREPGGTLVWSARVAGLHEVRSWVLSWGGDAEVLEPAELRDWVRGELDGARRRYG
jgi:predicted DNA-binding transcriptional regulator YafY